MPGIPRIVSVMNAPPIRPASANARIVTIGSMAFWNTWRELTDHSDRPLARAVRIKSWPSTSRVLARMSLVIPAIPGTPSTMAGTMMRVSKKPPHPEHGTQPSLRHPIHNRPGAVTITGTDMTNRDAATAAGSTQCPCRVAM